LPELFAGTSVANGFLGSNISLLMSKSKSYQTPISELLGTAIPCHPATSNARDELRDPPRVAELVDLKSNARPEYFADTIRALAAQSDEYR
jgi:hypothetical protein